MTPHSAYVWHPLNCRWHHIHSITPNYSFYDVTFSSVLTSHPLYQTLRPLYLCHHDLSADITPTILWHLTHLLCDIIWTIYNITSNPYVITLLYLWHQNLYMNPHPVWRSRYTIYRWHQSHSLCHHRNCIENITLTLCMNSHSPNVWHLLHYTRHHLLA